MSTHDFLRFLNTSIDLRNVLLRFIGGFFELILTNNPERLLCV